MSAIAGTGAMLLNGQERATGEVGRSLPNLVCVPWHDFRAITRFLSLSDGDDQAPQVLLTGGLLVRVQPEEPSQRF